MRAVLLLGPQELTPEIHRFCASLLTLLLEELHTIIPSGRREGVETIVAGYLAFVRSFGEEGTFPLTNRGLLIDHDWLALSILDCPLAKGMKRMMPSDYELMLDIIYEAARGSTPDYSRLLHMCTTLVREPPEGEISDSRAARTLTPFERLFKNFENLLRSILEIIHPTNTPLFWS